MSTSNTERFQCFLARVQAMRGEFLALLEWEREVKLAFEHMLNGEHLA